MSHKCLFVFILRISQTETCFVQRFLREKIKAMQIQSYAGQKIEMIAEKMNPVIRGWLNYFMKYCHSLVKTTMDCLNLRLVRWAMHKYKKLRGRRIRARKWLVELAQREPKMFVHWAIGYYPY